MHVIDGGGSMPPGGASGPGFKVNKENVLQMARETLDTARWLEDEVAACAKDIRMEPARLDPVSQDMARALNERFIGAPDSYINRGLEYVGTLRDAVEQMKAAAATYGYTDTEIKTALGTEGTPNA
ncbi:hypothetical protein [Crossiella sp. CA198]|uniref:hypothetical protein n=1 Tax=Crossiella sp. CA198 TaxID=3455607 RepID=UPI003F8D29A0